MYFVFMQHHVPWETVGLCSYEPDQEAVRRDLPISAGCPVCGSHEAWKVYTSETVYVQEMDRLKLIEQLREAQGG